MSGWYQEDRSELPLRERRLMRAWKTNRTRWQPWMGRAQQVASQNRISYELAALIRGETCKYGYAGCGSRYKCDRHAFQKWPRRSAKKWRAR